LNPPEAAPPLTLRNYTGGAPISLASMRGKAVFVTFVYTHCPNVCPLIVSGLAAAQRALGPAASKVRFVAVTVDPRRDTPAAVKTFLTTRGALGRMYYLLGTRGQLEPIWKAWHVTITLNQKQLTHSAVIYGISATGELKIVYPSNFSPAQIVHDAAVLERS
jgi:protein SCO1/2